MSNALRISLGMYLTLFVAACGYEALAAPANVTVTPPPGARFLVGQRFDLRIEGKGTGPFSATLAINGVGQAFTSGTQNTMTTDGITSSGWGGFNIRGYSNKGPGFHTIAATFTESTGTIQVSARFQIIDPNPASAGEGKGAKNIIILLGDGMGAAHRTAARLVKYGVTAETPNGYHAMDKFPGTGMITTHSLDKLAKRRGQLLSGATTYAVDDYHAPDQPMLEEMTGAALDVLKKNQQGFVLMVEGAHIDKQSHMMDADRAIGETIEFDNAVDVCRRFAETHRETIVIVLADHECSGFSLIGALTGGMSGLVQLPPDDSTLDPDIPPHRQNVVGTYDLAGFPRYSILADGHPDTLVVAAVRHG